MKKKMSEMSIAELNSEADRLQGLSERCALIGIACGAIAFVCFVASVILIAAVH